MLDRLVRRPPIARSAESGRRMWWAVYLGVCLVLAAGLVAGVNVSRLLVDPVLAAGVADTSPWLGALSNLGLMLWSAAAALCAVSAVARQQNGDREGARALTATAALIALLAADDAFLVHDHLLERLTGIGWSEWLVLAVIASATLAWWVGFGRTPLLWDRLQLLAACLFGLSLLIDLIPMHTGPVLRVPEDGAKLLGIVTVLRLASRWTMASIQPPLPSAPATPTGRSRHVGGRSGGRVG